MQVVCSCEAHLAEAHFAQKTPLHSQHAHALLRATRLHLAQRSVFGFNAAIARGWIGKVNNSAPKVDNRVLFAWVGWRERHVTGWLA